MARVKGLTITGTWDETADWIRLARGGFGLEPPTADGQLAVNSGIAVGHNAPTSAIDISGSITFRGISAPGVASLGQGRLYYDSTSNTVKLSLNGGGYADIGNGIFTGSIASTQLAFGSGANAIAGSANLTWNGNTLWVANPTATSGSWNKVLQLKSNAGNAGSGPYLQFSNDAAADAGRIGTVDISNWGGAMVFWTKPADGNGAGASREAVRFAENGNVGIGTGATMPTYAGYTTLAINHATTGATVDLQQGGSTIAEFFADATSAGVLAIGGRYLSFRVNTSTEAIRILSTGEVGIGTSPGQLLHVRKDQNGFTVATVQNNTAAASGGDAPGAAVSASDGTNAATLLVWSNNHSNSGLANAGGISVSRSGGTAFEIYNNSSTSWRWLSGTAPSVEKMRLTTDGNLGIGVDPTFRIHARKADSTELRLESNTSNGSLNSAAISLFDYGVDDGWVVAKRSSGWGSGRANSLEFSFYNGSYVDAVSFQSNGNVVIGATNSPSGLYKLYVKGGNDRNFLVDNDGSQYTAMYWGNNGNLKATMFWDNSDPNFLIGTQGSTSGRMTFQVADNQPIIWATQSTERVRITGTGAVGIGTIGGTPDALLHVKGTAGQVGIVGGNVSAFASTKANSLLILANDNATDQSLISVWGGGAGGTTHRGTLRWDYLGDMTISPGRYLNLGVQTYVGGPLIVTGGTFPLQFSYIGTEQAAIAVGSGNNRITFNTNGAGMVFGTTVTAEHQFTFTKNPDSNADSAASVKINPSAAASDERLFVAQVASSTKAFLDASGNLYTLGNVGIGETGPGTALQITRSANEDHGIWVTNNSTGAAASAQLQLFQPESGSFNIHATSAAYSYQAGTWASKIVVAHAAPLAFVTTSGEYQFAVGSDNIDTSRVMNIKSTAVEFKKQTAKKTHSAFAGSDRVEMTGAIQTTNATQTTILAMTLEDTSTYLIEVAVMGRYTAGDRAFWKAMHAFAYREGGGATLSGTSPFSLAVDSYGGAAATATLTVSGNDVRVSVTGEAATTINWACTMSYQRVSGNA